MQAQLLQIHNCKFNPNSLIYNASRHKKIPQTISVGCIGKMMFFLPELRREYREKMREKVSDLSRRKFVRLVCKDEDSGEYFLWGNDNIW